MRLILKDEYEAFARSMENERAQGLRFNTLKTGLLKAEESCVSKFGLRQVPWCREGFTYASVARPGKHPYHEAGLYYIQEPSAMAAVEAMDVRPGEKILDLCAAPGGKSTQIAAKLAGRGLLVSNEINPSRAKILSQNIERMGIRNAVVLREDPKTLTGYFPGFFDKILVDVPCSGEGMFRKDDEAKAQWSEENIRRCAKRGQEILNCAASMLRPGGILLYSTCTFETEEDEGAVELFLRNHREFSLLRDVSLTGSEQFVPCSLPGSDKSAACSLPGSEHYMSPALAGLGLKEDKTFAMYRLWPHRIEGEGAFFALLVKSNESPLLTKSEEGSADIRKARKRSAPGLLKDMDLLAFVRKELGAIFNDNVFDDMDPDHLIFVGNELYMVPEYYPLPEGISMLRCGLNLGSIKKDRFEPSHSLALAVKTDDARCHHDLDSEGEDVWRYLSGNTLSTRQSEKNWTLISVDGYPLGWGKAVNGVIKNHYPKGLRLP